MYHITNINNIFYGINKKALDYYSFILISVFISFSFTHAQVDWQKYPDNPVLQAGQPTEWDYPSIIPGMILKHASLYHIWYDNDQDIGHAVSEDGISWIKDTLNPVLQRGPEGSWDHFIIELPKVLVLNDTLHMFYSGSASDDNFQIGHAISVDGSNWIKDSLNPVLQPGTNGSWDDGWVINGSLVAFDDNVFHIWYAAMGNGSSDIKIGHATSVNLNNSYWTKDPQNPVLTPSDNTTWEKNRLHFPSVTYDGNFFHMWYTGGEFFKQKIGYAWSADGRNWQKYPGNPVLDYGPEGSWDSYGVAFGSVLFDENIFKMWYTGYDGNIVSIGYSTSEITVKAGFQYMIKNDTVSFNDYSIVSITDWSWDFGDGQTSTEQNPLHVYADGGAYNVSLTASGPYGSDTRMETVQTIVAIEDLNNIVAEYTLKQNYPNPFNPVTMISYQLAVTSDVELSIYNLLGQKVATLVNKKQAAGKYSLNWDATGFTSGVYIYTLSTGTGYKQSRKLVLLK